MTSNPSDDLAAAALERAGVGVLVTAERGDRWETVYANPAFQRTVATVSTGASGTAWIDAVRSPASALALTEAVLAGRPCRVAVAFHRRSGEPAWADVTTEVFTMHGERHCVWTVTPRSASAELAEGAAWDDLTGLPGRALIRSRLRQALDESERVGGRVSVLHLGLDHFHTINETLGRSGGDELLMEVGSRLMRVLDHRDTVGRPESDQFVVLSVLPGSDDEAPDLGRRLRDAFHAPFQIQGRSFTITASGGVALSPQAGSTEKELLRNAESALRQAKGQGRGIFCFYTEQLGQQRDTALVLEQELREALARDELELHLQPKVSVASGCMVGAEGLARWTHPTHGLLSAGQFVPVAERAGLSVELGRWSLQEACRILRSWLDAGVTDVVPVAVNISARHFEQPDFPDDVHGALEEFAVPPELLEVEITESAVTLDPERAAQTARRMRALGISLALDDFGTAYSNLSQLRNIRVDKLKLDRSFVRDVTEDPEAATLAASAISTGKALRLALVAEGIETWDQFAFVARRGCDQIQGHLLRTPQPEPSFRTLLGTVQEPLMTPWQREKAADHAPTLLVIDDEPNVLRSIERTLRNEDYRLLTAASVPEAMHQLNRHEVDVVLADHRMPGGSGIDFLAHLRELYPDTVRVMLSGYTDLETMTQAINRGAVFRFIAKPWEDEDLRAHLRNAFAHRERIVAPSGDNATGRN